MPHLTRPVPGCVEAHAAAVTRLLDGGRVAPVFQPIVELVTGRPIGYEALARGPRGHPLERPDDLFAAARSAGVLTALDATCLRSAVGVARTGGLTAPWTLFVNIEPDSHTVDILAALASPSLASPSLALPLLPVVVELTERALAEDPADVLDTVALIRRLGWGVALDDVGVNPDSLALLPLIAPDVVKLDAALVQEPPDAHTARVFSAVSAEVERSGSVVVAEGIETVEHRESAAALGAQLGQGWLFDRPGRLPDRPDGPPPPALRLRPAVPPPADLTPFGAAARVREVRSAGTPLLLAMSKHLEREAIAIGESCLVLSSFQTSAAFAPAARRYAALVEGNAYVAVFGSGLPECPAPGVRGIDLDPGEPLAREWNLVIVGPHFAAVLAARVVGTGTGAGACWDYVLSHDRDLAVQAATCLMKRIPSRDVSPSGR